MYYTLTFSPNPQPAYNPHMPPRTPKDHAHRGDHDAPGAGTHY